MRMRTLLSLALLASPALAEPVDNCATLLGSISIELRFARQLPDDRRTTFVCPKDTSSLIGASKQRILNSLGPPDAVGSSDADSSDAAQSDASPSDATSPVDAEGGGGGASQGTKWSYFFTSKPAGERGPGIPRLTFIFDDQQKLGAVDCHLTR
jgi:hypothetical protein